MIKRSAFSLDLGGRTLSAEFNALAEQAHGSCTVRYGNSVVLATAVMVKEEKVGQGFFPLTVDYEEKFYAAGQILGSRFVRREGRPSEEAILSGRVVDRTIRPLFPKNLRKEVQVVITVLSIDEDDPDVLAVLAASLALGVSHIPWGGPVSAVRIGKRQNFESFDINPTYRERGADCLLDLLACGKGQEINMIEVGAKEASETLVEEALARALSETEKLNAFQEEIINKIGKPKETLPEQSNQSELEKIFKESVGERLEKTLFSGSGKEGLFLLEREWLQIAEKETEKNPSLSISNAREIFEEAVDEALHRGALERGARPDGRALTELRPLYAAVGDISPVLHGSGTFFRGGTHVLSVLTLGGPQDSLLIDTVEEQEVKKRFMHHYNFPPFSTGETGRMGGFNRRMVGHGALAEKALEPVIPPVETFPYTIRLVSECLSSNGSTSMASVCASTLALMDGGVPIKAPVAGIAIGLMRERASGRYALLTDIQGAEDHHGDMDFKVAGTKEGITALQLDIKVEGIPLPILKEALQRAREARLSILDTLHAAIPAARAEISARAPKIEVTKIKKEQIGLVIGSQGKTINEIREKTGTEIEIEEDGTVYITGRDGAAEKARKIIEEMTREYRVGERYEGVVTKITEFGAFVRLNSHAEGLVHISEIAPFRLGRVEDALKEEEHVPVSVIGVDERGRIRLSIKEADPQFAERKGIRAVNGK